MTKIKYANEVGKFCLEKSPIKGWRRGQNSDGYGTKISTDWILIFEEDNRRRRVYATCYSNVASYWIIYKGNKLYLHEYEF